MDDTRRELEAALEVLDVHISDVLRSTKELTKIKRAEESEHQIDENLLVHLGKKLEALEKERDKLKLRQKSVQDSLTQETKVRKEMTETLIQRITSFSKANPIVDAAGVRRYLSISI